MIYEKIIDKLRKKEDLLYNDIKIMVNDYVNDKISDEIMTEFLKLICKNKLSLRETLDLTDIMIKSGEKLDLSLLDKNTVDKHSTGGIGDKVSLIVGPIVASLGLAMPKMSGRGLGITGGTIDKLESIDGYKVNLEKKEFIKILNEIGVSIISQSNNIVPADKKIYSLRDVTGTVDNDSLIAASIMSKKIASSSDVIVIDMKVGNGAFKKDVKSAVKLSKMMIKIANAYNRKLICILTDMNEPLGMNIGNALEIEEVIDFFNGFRDDKLEKVVTTIASYMVSYGKMIPLEKAKREVETTLNNNKAKEVFYKWIEAQGGNINKLTIKAKQKEIYSPKDGYISSLDASKIGLLVRDLGAGRKEKNDKIDYNVGIILNKTKTDKIKEDELLGTIYYNNKLEDMEQRFIDAFVITNKKQKQKEVILKIIK